VLRVIDELVSKIPGRLMAAVEQELRELLRALPASGWVTQHTLKTADFEDIPGVKIR
jgi:hypothetical protein